ncbi:MAG TPA: SPFH domain-containing protein [Lachnospiraceae bacterium]|nr:SPFH domain-containing protein [Lachnospiraceae bacterium]
MGLIKAAKDAIGSLLADQWREYFYCDSLSSDILMVKGQKRVNQGRNSNTKSTENIISNGSIVAVNEGQCMIIVDQGKISDFCAESGEFVYDNSTEPSLFYGKLGDNLKQTFSLIGRRFSMGGNTGKDQRVYFFNTKEVMNNLFGTSNPVPFRVVDNNIGLDVDISIRCNGEYTFKIADPLLFYSNVCGNVSDEYQKNELISMMKGELITALQPAFSRLSDMGIRYSAIAGHTMELTNALNEELSEKWGLLRGIQMISMTINGMKASEEDEQMIKDLQRTAVFRNTDMAAANLATAQAEAMKSAAANTSTGPMMAFAGMNMAQMTGGMNANSLFEMAGGKQNNTAGSVQDAQPAKPAKEANAVLGWTCNCGKVDNRGKFCAECGKLKPADVGWTCSCGHVNQGKFCQECGIKKPEGAPLYKCDKCGWEPEDPGNPPKFCPECGDVFDNNDLK